MEKKGRRSLAAASSHAPDMLVELRLVSRADLVHRTDHALVALLDPHRGGADALHLLDGMAHEQHGHVAGIYEALDAALALLLEKHVAHGERLIDDVYRQQVSWGLDSADVRSRLGARYARYILSALERNCDARAGLNHADRVAFCRSVMDDGLFRVLVLDARPQGRGARVCVGLLKTRSALVWCAVGRIIHLVRSRAGLAYRKATFSR